MFVFKWETRRTFSQHGNNFWRVLYGAKSAQQNLDRKTKTLATDCIIVYKRSVLRRQSRDTNRNMKRLFDFLTCERNNNKCILYDAKIGKSFAILKVDQ